MMKMADYIGRTLRGNGRGDSVSRKWAFLSINNLYNGGAGEQIYLLDRSHFVYSYESAIIPLYHNGGSRRECRPNKIANKRIGGEYVFVTCFVSQVPL